MSVETAISGLEEILEALDEWLAEYGHEIRAQYGEALRYAASMTQEVCEKLASAFDGE